jgi:CheY-like chemotaxis protein
MVGETCDLRGERVLLVHNNDDFVESLRAALAGDGCNVQHVETAAEGLGMVGLFRPLVVVTGLLLEAHDSGFRLTEEIKRNPLTAHIGVVMVTANRERTGFEFSQERDGSWMRTDRYFEMPVETAAVVRAVQEVMAAAREAREALETS